MGYLEQFLPTVTAWLLTSGIKIFVILAIAMIVRGASGRIIDSMVRKLVVSNHHVSPEAEKKREDTIIRVFTATFGALIWILAILMVLSELGADIGPLLAAAGIAGIAFGFGGQYLIRDIISGLFIILENQFRMGDVVCVDGTCGLVEDINLRRTILRDLDGVVHHIPNGEIKKASNMSKEFARVNLNIGIGYNSDLQKVEGIVNRVGREMSEASEWKDRIISAPRFERVDNFGDSAVEIKILGDVKPLAQWAVAGELRKRLKIAFDKEGVDIPFPQRVIHMKK